jgi:hypothetical protein
MKIDAMVEREDFYLINEKTLENYFKIVFSKDLKISTNEPFTASKVVIYPKINAIVTRTPSKKVLKYIFSEFNVRNNWQKFILGKLYTGICLFSFGLLATKTLRFHKHCPVGDNILIWPCNRKIRIFDFENMFVDSIVKEGFTKKYFNSELTFRLRSSYDFIPPILKYGENWYREIILPGQPLARISDNNQYNKSCNDAIIYMKTIIEKTIRYVDPIEYAHKLLQSIIELLGKAKDEKKITTGDEIYGIAKLCAIKAKKAKKKIPIAVSHGDLQSGNLWVDVDKKKTYIIDWETNDIRSIWYDPATLLLSTRRYNGVLNMANDCNTLNVKNALFINDSCKEYNMESIIGILILEDIIFYLEDNLELPLEWGGDLIDNFGRQLMRLNW